MLLVLLSLNALQVFVFGHAAVERQMVAGMVLRLGIALALLHAAGRRFRPRPRSWRANASNASPSIRTRAWR